MKDGKLEGKDVVEFTDWTNEDYKHMITKKDSILIFPYWDDDHSKEFELPPTEYLELIQDAIKFLQNQEVRLKTAMEECE